MPPEKPFGTPADRPAGKTREKSRARRGPRRRGERSGSRPSSASSTSPSSVSSAAPQSPVSTASQGPASPADDKSAGFSPTQQRAIFYSRQVTKHSAPHKNYSHVPCRFFRQGACQAGDSCPFSHSLNALAADQTPCKYFQRGHCRFGAKCANAHILPDGTRANPTKYRGALASAPASAPASLPLGEPLGGPLGAQVRGAALPDAVFSRNSAYCAGAFSSSAPGLAPAAPLQPYFADASAVVFEDDADPADPACDFDGEDFIPGELADLLTPRELERRRSSLPHRLSFNDSGPGPAAPLPAPLSASGHSPNYLASPVFDYVYQRDAAWPADPPSLASVHELGAHLARIKIPENSDSRAAGISL